MNLTTDSKVDDVATCHELSEIFVKELNIEVPTIETDLIETGILDSFTFLELLVHMEKRFAMRVSMKDLDIESFRSIVKIAAFVRTVKQGKAAAAGS
jgi:acyl carrier protein